ncbi:hypothetical protein LINPERHAP2_LOCUS13884 [Linum perenne]
MLHHTSRVDMHHCGNGESVEQWDPYTRSTN